MGLLELSQQDSDAILSDTCGFNTGDVTVTDPQGVNAVVTGIATNVGIGVDHDTGLPIRGRRIFIKLSVNQLKQKGFIDLPRGEPALSQKPWRIEFKEPNGELRIYKVSYADIDYSLGRVDCTLELYDDKRSSGPSI